MASGTGVARSRVRKQVHPWRVVIVVGGLALVASLLLVLGYNSDTSDQGRQELSADVRQVRPAPGSIATPQTDVEVRLRSGLTGVLVLNGKRLPEDQLVIDNATSTIRFQPGEGREVSRLPAGRNDLAVLYWGQTEPEPAKPKSFGWGFQVGA
ncbi:MAG TPA: hypothetical protein VKI01_14555 [Acidimicrobiia bacterium]|nr:hypothetical protein [Acidimicrobiia bacterium]